MAKAKIEQHWSIGLGGTRSTRVGSHTAGRGLMLVTTNGRTDRGWGPVRWVVVDDLRGTVAKGETWQGVEYSALVRQAMLDAERAAAPLLQALEAVAP